MTNETRHTINRAVKELKASTKSGLSDVEVSIHLSSATIFIEDAQRGLENK